jgi:hypothetical protein
LTIFLEKNSLISLFSPSAHQIHQMRISDDPSSRLPQQLTCQLSETEVVSKLHIAFESKAQADEKAQHTLKYVSILKRSATQLSDARWGFETTSRP